MQTWTYPFRNIWDNEQMMTELCKLFLWMWLKSNSLESEIKWMWKVPEAFQWRLDRNDFPDYYRPPLQKESLLRDKIKGQYESQLCSDWTAGISALLSGNNRHFLCIVLLPAGGQDLMKPVQCTTAYCGSPSFGGPSPFLREERWSSSASV